MARRKQPGPFSRGGNAAIEFALLAPVLLTLLTGIAELGMAGYQAMQVQAAVAAGVIYVTKNGWSSSSTAAINTAVTSATGTAGIIASTSSVFYGCGGTGVIVTQTSSTAACPDGYAPGWYITINAAVPHQTIMPYLNLNLPASFTATTTMRVQ